MCVCVHVCLPVCVDGFLRMCVCVSGWVRRRVKLPKSARRGGASNFPQARGVGRRVDFQKARGVRRCVRLSKSWCRRVRLSRSARRMAARSTFKKHAARRRVRLSKSARRAAARRMFQKRAARGGASGFRRASSARRRGRTVKKCEAARPIFKKRAARRRVGPPKSARCGVRFGTGLCAYVVGWPPHPHSHQHTDARPHVETTGSHASTHMQTQPYNHTQTHTPHTKAHPHTCAHVACSQGACRGVWGGGTPGVRTNEGVHKGEIGMNSREFT